MLFYGTMLGAEVVYVRSLNPRVILEALRELRVTTMVVTPQLLEIFWTGIRREVERHGKGRSSIPCAASPGTSPTGSGGSIFARVHRSWAGSCGCSPSPAPTCRRNLQRRWEDIGVRSSRGTAPRRPVPLRRTPSTTTRSGWWGGRSRRSSCATPRRPRDPHRVARRSARATGRTPRPLPRPSRRRAGTTPGDIGRIDEHGRLVLSGRKKNIIVLPNGLNVFPEDIENVLQDHGLNQAVVLETAPGRIEAVVMPPGTLPLAARRGGQEGRDEAQDAAVRAEIERIIRAANAELWPSHQRIDGWRLWPEPDFPRTHTLKIQRVPVQLWAGADVPLALREAGAGSCVRCLRSQGWRARWDAAGQPMERGAPWDHPSARRRSS